MTFFKKDEEKTDEQREMVCVARDFICFFLQRNIKCEFDPESMLVLVIMYYMFGNLECGLCNKSVFRYGLNYKLGLLRKCWSPKDFLVLHLNEDDDEGLNCCNFCYDSVDKKVDLCNGFMKKYFGCPLNNYLGELLPYLFGEECMYCKSPNNLKIISDRGIICGPCNLYLYGVQKWKRTKDLCNSLALAHAKKIDMLSKRMFTYEQKVRHVGVSNIFNIRRRVRGSSVKAKRYGEYINSEPSLQHIIKERGMRRRKEVIRAKNLYDTFCLAFNYQNVFDNKQYPMDCFDRNDYILLESDGKLTDEQLESIRAKYRDWNRGRYQLLNQQINEIIEMDWNGDMTTTQASWFCTACQDIAYEYFGVYDFYEGFFLLISGDTHWNYHQCNAIYGNIGAVMSTYTWSRFWSKRLYHHPIQHELNGMIERRCNDIRVNGLYHYISEWLFSKFGGRHGDLVDYIINSFLNEPVPKDDYANPNFSSSAGTILCHGACNNLIGLIRPYTHDRFNIKGTHVPIYIGRNLCEATGLCEKCLFNDHIFRRNKGLHQNHVECVLEPMKRLIELIEDGIDLEHDDLEINDGWNYAIFTRSFHHNNIRNYIRICTFSNDAENYKYCWGPLVKRDREQEKRRYRNNRYKQRLSELAAKDDHVHTSTCRHRSRNRQKTFKWDDEDSN